FFTKDGYFKKITPLSLRMGGEHKLKEGDELTQAVETDNKFEVMFFTDKCQVYKTKINDFADTKASVLGDFVPAKLDFDAGENPVYMAVTDNYAGFMIFVFENGKMAKVEMNQYMTKTNRKKLINAYSDKSPLIKAIYVKEESDILIENINGRKLVVNTASINAKTSKSTQGVAVMKIRKGHKVLSAKLYEEGDLDNVSRYRARTLPASGKLPEEDAQQLTLN
ncbi:MAG: topoisomerase IV, partial [Clostridia bacterium]|nr:topoisomerase IV [Clostridia bacterium]